VGGTGVIPVSTRTNTTEIDKEIDMAQVQKLVALETVRIVVRAAST